MNIQRFHAPTAREALALARAAFGDATLILSNRQLAEGVEVVAAAESDLAALDASGSVTLGAEPVATKAAPRTAPKPAPALQPVAVAAGASTQEVVHADTEQLSMSTLSFQDYVRERMLRRQSEKNTAANGKATASARATASSTATANTQAAPAVHAAPTTVAAQPAAFAQPSTTSLPPMADPTARAPRTASDARVAMQGVVADGPADEHHALPAAGPLPASATPAAPIARSAPMMGVTAAPIAASAAAAPAAELASTLMAELGAMKRLMEERFNTLSWLGQARQDPIHSNLMLKLVRAGYSPALARSVLEPIEIGPDANAAVRAVMSGLERLVGADPASPSLAEEGGVFALIGATGVGKTTTAAKLAAQCARLHGASSVGLVTLDTHRVGAHEQLRSHARGLGIVAHLAHDRAALAELLALFTAKKMVIIDTAGVAPRDPRRRDVLDLLDMPSVKRVLVLNAGAHGDTLDEMATSFKVGGTRQAILSKTDEAAKLGPALDTLIRHQLALRGVANGQRIPQDWKAASGAELVRESMRARERTPFDPRTADMDFFFSPAACAV